MLSAQLDDWGEHYKTYFCVMMYWKNVLTNKYLLATSAFVALLFFSDKNNVFDQYDLIKQYNKVKAEHAYYVHQIETARREYTELFSNDKNLEKFAREKYLMKRDDEEVFVIVDEKKSDWIPTVKALIIIKAGNTIYRVFIGVL